MVGPSVLAVLIDDRLDWGGLLNQQTAGPCVLQNLVDQCSDALDEVALITMKPRGHVIRHAEGPPSASKRRRPKPNTRHTPPPSHRYMDPSVVPTLRSQSRRRANLLQANKMPDLTDNQNSQRIGKTKTRDRLTKDFLRAMHPDSTHTVHAEYSSDIQPPGLLRRAGPGARTARRLPCPTGWTARRSTPTRARP